MTRGIVNRILPFSSVDGPGNRTAIFLQGCNFNCLYCHNPETISDCLHCGKCIEECPYGALTLENNKVIWNKTLCKKCDKCLEVCPNNSSPKAISMNIDEVLKEINKTKVFISGITVSGGECTLQCDFLTSLFKEVKKMGLTCFVDTNGSTPLYNQKELIEVMDMAMVDLKSYNPKEHKILTGMDNKVVLENIKYLAGINKLYEVRTVIVPKVLNNHYTVDMTSKLIASLNPNIRYKIIKYRPIGVRTDMIDSYTPSDEMMEALKNIAKENGCKNIILV
ncbi:YjjW family glycine radical enzyme activase [Clostridium ganghwense]|uniref:YjjW family glycine radical enzyme activase n=1 Tax=Clostridium ganghwense TaxID=312089 RepID=A0ABT4CKE5_9CLOT|nr:YjjW family glycine radical enzyme activase [Clostridium ganghwense]MCY6369512.1 YjjW family glycine radical enzyme activase [Clostridium ganghwense]